MNISARRVLLQKALRGGLGLMGVGLTGGISGNSVDGPYTSPLAAGRPVSDPDSDERNKFSDLLYKQMQAVTKRRNLLYEASQNMDMDLQVLRSTSPTWRLLQMYDRVKSRRAVTDKIQERINRIWQEPLFKIRDQVISWVTGEQ